MISAYVHKNQRDLNRYLPLLTMTYRSTVQRSTGFNPNKQIIGRECILPVQPQIGCPHESSTCENYNEYVQDLLSRLEQIFQLVRENLKNNICKMKRDYDTRISQHNYQVGDIVYCLDLTKTVGRCKNIEPNIWHYKE